MAGTMYQDRRASPTEVKAQNDRIQVTRKSLAG